MNQSTPNGFALIGPGRAGTAIGVALVSAGRPCVGVAGRDPDRPSTQRVAVRLDAPATTVAVAVAHAGLVVLATPDATLDALADELAPAVAPGALVVHLSGARGVDALTPIVTARADVEVGALHPLQTLTGADAAEALRGAWAAVAGPPAVTELATRLGLRPFTVPDTRRAAYHAAAAVASNHLVALLGQVERLAADADVPLAAFEPLVRTSVDHVFAVGPAAALTGPVARGDVETVAGHLDAIAESERPAYRALAESARRLAGRDDPALREVLA
jgi:predicted short-subunit dehydrogenase-like oxidoreductase (DUF2520 family)